MSYRSIKHVLGETSLERKCRFLFGGCLLILIATSFWVYGWQTEKLVDGQIRNTGRLLVDRVMLTTHWTGLEGLSQDNEPDELSPFGPRQPNTVLPNTMFEFIVKDLTTETSKQEYEWKFIRPESADATGAPNDEFEGKLLQEFLKAKPDMIADADADAWEYRDRVIEAENKYLYYEPIRARESCLISCHKAPPGGIGIDWPGAVPVLGDVTAEAPGDLLAVARITIPYGPTQRAMNWNRALLLSAAIITVFLAMVSSYVIIRYVIVKPLRHLRDVSEAVSHGDIAVRADIHTGDEFESLAVAFNRMLQHLITAQEELRDVNSDLDGKVDELAQVNMRLYEMNTVKSEFLATMSHELRTPLNSILGFSDVLGSIDSLSEKQKRYVENIQTSGRVLLDMINAILDLAKMESGKMDIRPTDFGIGQIIQAQCDMARPLTEKKNIDIETRLAPELPTMRQDQARVQQVLNNLLSNAIKFTPEGGQITVSARREEGDLLVMEVADTGVGIAEEDQQAIFEKFRQGRTAMPDGDAMTREYTGTGLGLSIVRELCKLLGGDVSVESALGKGSTFTVRLPWQLQQQPRLDSSLAESFDEFAKSGVELSRGSR